MPTLIQGLVALATDPTVKASALLRKVFVAIRQLKQPEWTTWIYHDLMVFDGVRHVVPQREALQALLRFSGA